MSRLEHGDDAENRHVMTRLGSRVLQTPAASPIAPVYGPQLVLRAEVEAL